MYNLQYVLLKGKCKSHIVKAGRRETVDDRWIREVKHIAKLAMAQQLLVRAPISKYTVDIFLKALQQCNVAQSPVVTDGS